MEANTKGRLNTYWGYAPPPKDRWAKAHPA